MYMACGQLACNYLLGQYSLNPIRLIIVNIPMVEAISTGLDNPENLTSIPIIAQRITSE